MIQTPEVRIIKKIEIQQQQSLYKIQVSKSFNSNLLHYDPITFNNKLELLSVFISILNVKLLIYLSEFMQKYVLLFILSNLIFRNQYFLIPFLKFIVPINFIKQILIINITQTKHQMQFQTHGFSYLQATKFYRFNKEDRNYLKYCQQKIKFNQRLIPQPQISVKWENIKDKDDIRRLFADFIKKVGEQMSSRQTEINMFKLKLQKFYQQKMIKNPQITNRNVKNEKQYINKKAYTQFKDMEQDITKNQIFEQMINQKLQKINSAARELPLLTEQLSKMFRQNSTFNQNKQNFPKQPIQVNKNEEAEQEYPERQFFQTKKIIQNKNISEKQLNLNSQVNKNGQQIRQEELNLQISIQSQEYKKKIQTYSENQLMPERFTFQKQIKFQEQIEQLKVKNKILEKEIKEKNELMDELKDVNQRMNAQNMTKSMKIKQIQKSLQILKRQPEIKSGQILQKNKEIIQLKRRSKSIKQFKSFNILNNKMPSNNVIEEKPRYSQEAQMSENENMFNNQLNECTQKFTVLDLQQQKGQIIKVQAEKQEMTNKINQLTSLNTNLRDQVNNLKQKINELTNQISQLILDNNSLSQTKDEIEAMMQIKQKQYEQVYRLREVEKNQLCQDLQTEKRLINQLNDKLSLIQEQLNLYAKQKSDLQFKLKQALNRVQEVQLNIQEIKVRNIQLLKINQEYQKHKIESLRLKKQNQQVKKQNLSLKKQCSELVKQCNSFKKQCSQLKKQFESQKSKYLQTHNNFSELIGQNKQLRSKFQQTTQLIKEIKHKSKNDQIMTSRIPGMNARISEIQEMQKRLKQQQLKNKKINQKNQIFIADLNKEIQYLHKQLEKRNQEIKKYEIMNKNINLKK